MESTLQRNEAIQQGEPIELYGLTYYPITMAHYQQFVACRDVWTIRLSTLPARYIVYDFITALWIMEYDRLQSGEKPSGVFYRALKFWLLSLRIDTEPSEILEKNTKFKQEADKRILIDTITVTQGDKTATVTPSQLSNEIRRLVAAQNGLELPDENENAEIIQANEELKKLKSDNGAKIKYDLNALVASVAYQYRIRPKEIYEKWTCAEFEGAKAAADRDKRYTMYGTAEMSGMVSFKNGNPAPSWCFDALDDTFGTVSVDKITKAVDMAAN